MHCSREGANDLLALRMEGNTQILGQRGGSRAHARAQTLRNAGQVLRRQHNLTHEKTLLVQINCGKL